MALELLSDQGFRIDGRRAQELRQLQCRLGVFSQADGSAYIEQGNTKVLAAFYGHHEVGQQNSFSLDCDLWYATATALWKLLFK